MKPTILMLPSWYPTKENPHNGCFFREQALAMQKNFNFVVVTYKCKKEIAVLYAIKKLLKFTKPKITFVHSITKSIIEYDIENALNSIEDILNQGKDLNNFLWEIIKYVKDILIYKSSGKADLYSQ